MKTQPKVVEPNDNSTDTATEEKPRVEVFVDLAEKKSFVLYLMEKGETFEQNDTFEITHTVDPVLEDGKARITGKVVLGKDSILPHGRLVGELIPYLETKIPTDFTDLGITLSDIPFTVVADPNVHLRGAMFGEYITFKDIKKEYAFIMRYGVTKGAILSSNEPLPEDRAMFVYSTVDDAKHALVAFKAYPPFSKSSFYQKAEVVTLENLVTDGLGDERFIFYDIWQKSVANLSAHMDKK